MLSWSTTGKSCWNPWRTSSIAAETDSVGASVRTSVIMAFDTATLPTVILSCAALDSAAALSHTNTPMMTRNGLLTTNSPNSANKQRESFAESRGDLRRVLEARAHGQRRAQHAAAVHRERRQQVEDREYDVHPHHLRQEQPDAVRLRRRGERNPPQEQRQVEHGDDRHRDGRTGDGDQQFLARTRRHPLQPGDAADRQERDALRLHAEARGHERVTELVQHDGKENREREQHADHRRARRVRLLVVRKRDPGEQEEERRVNVDVDSLDPCDRP